HSFPTRRSSDLYAADGRPYIETIPRRGYRFVATVQEDGEAVAPPSVAPSSEQPGTAVQSSQKRIQWLWALAVLALAVTGYFASRRIWPRQNSSPQRVMLAVLPFVNLSGDAHEDYFADGLTEEMTAQLGQF